MKKKQKFLEKKQNKDDFHEKKQLIIFFDEKKQIQRKIDFFSLKKKQKASKKAKWCKKSKNVTPAFNPM